MNVNLHIDRLVLDGISISPGQCPRLQAAVEGELTRLLAEGGPPPRWLKGGSVDRIAAGAIHLMHGSEPAALGAEIARGVYGGQKA